MELRIPFAEKDSAKAAAFAAGGRLVWNADSKTWGFKGGDLPPELKKYAIDAVGGDDGGDDPRVWGLEIPFELRSWAGGEGAKWAADKKGFFYAGTALPKSLRPFEAKPYSLEWLAAAEACGLDVSLPPPAAPLPPREWQKAATLAIAKAFKAKAPGFLLADQTGLGKTFSAWTFVRDEKSFNSVLICCPASVIAHWRRTVMALGDGGKRVAIINYDRLQKLFEVPDTVPKGRGKSKSKAPVKRAKSRKGIARFGSVEGFDCVLWDESHKLKNPDTARSKLANKVTASSGFCIYLSATAGQTPIELGYLGGLFSFATGESAAARNFEDWIVGQDVGMTKGEFGKWRWRGSPEDRQAINAWLFGGRTPMGIRRRASEINGWRELERQFFPLDPEGRLGVELEKMGRLAVEGGRAAKTMSGKAKSNATANTLAILLKMRMLASKEAVPMSVERVCDWLESGMKVAVSVAFLETQRMLAEQLGKAGVSVAIMNGGQGLDEKEAQRLSFQREERDVVIFTQEEGISLHQGEHGDTPRILLIHDPRWSAIQTSQIEGRCHRDGFFAPAVWRFFCDSLEEDICMLLKDRMLGMGGMLGDVDTGLEEAFFAAIEKRYG